MVPNVEVYEGGSVLDKGSADWIANVEAVEDKVDPESDTEDAAVEVPAAVVGES